MLTVPSSNSRIARFRKFRSLFPKARWQSGYAAACKAVYAGSIPTLASIIYEKDEPSMAHFHVATQTRGSASLLHSLSLVLAHPCAKDL